MLDNTEYALNAVAEFQMTFETPEDPTFWSKLVQEESKEVLEAVENLIKEISDLVYVGMGYTNVGGDLSAFDPNSDIGTAVKWANAFAEVAGSEILFEAFKRVHESNMSKLDDNGNVIRREDGKVLKGPNYAPPVLSDLVRG